MASLLDSGTVVDLRNGEVVFPLTTATKCLNGYIQYTGKACFRSETNLCGAKCEKILLEKLDSCKLLAEIIDVLDDLVGGWTIIYYRDDLKKVLVGRDFFGRKSILWTRLNERFHFSSFAGDRKNWHDLPCGTITVLDLCSLENNIFFYTFECGKSWVEQFEKIKKVQRKVASERLVLSHTLPTELIRREVMAKVMLEQLKGAVERTFCDLNDSTKCVSIFFSGGVDSLLITHVMAQFMPSFVLFDLVNVAFDKAERYDKAPDRLQSKTAYKYLKSCYPERCIRLLLVNISLTELIVCRKNHISNAVAPSYSVLDDSIGCVQWFAARGEGVFFDDEKEPTASGKSDAKIVVVGSGADELFGGYMRHRTIYMSKGRNAVLEELRQELERIGERNLGRDDRVVSSLGKDLRSPFLDDLFVEWVISLPLEDKTDFTKPRGIGEKWLIREALRLLDTPKVLYTTPKRAMQFGAGVAKLENRRERGHDLCPRLLE